MTKEGKNRISQDVLILIGMLMLLTFICRLWPILLLMILTLFFMMLRMLVLPRVSQEDTLFRAEPMILLQEPKKPGLMDVAHSEILSRITHLVAEDFPEAKWVWEKSNAKKLIENGEEIFVRLNHAGGYRRGKVQIHNLQVVGISYQGVQTDSDKEDGDDAETEANGNSDYPVQENYELLAFEWVDANIIEINEKCNDAIGDNAEYILLTDSDLPVKESWSAICNELYRENVVHTECLEEGIRVYLTERE